MILVIKDVVELKRVLSVITMLIVSLFILTGCGKQVINGIIVDKQYHQSYTTVTYAHVGKTIVPMTHRHPERYVVTIEGILYEDDKPTDEVGESDYNVKKRIYDKYDIGDNVTKTDLGCD